MIAIAEPVDADALRLRHEFLETPALRLTAAQAARLFGVSLAHASAMLSALEHEAFLIRLGDGTYRRADPLLA